MALQQTRRIPIETPGGTMEVWTQRNGSNPEMRLLLLHGGPGATHEYFKSFETWFPQEIEYIYYDQLGSYHSDNPADRSYWTIPRFVDEIEQVRAALELGPNNFFLLGHSWGGILAMEYALTHQDALKGLIISNMMSSCPEYQRYADEVLAARMEPGVVARIRELEAAGEYESEEYMDLLIPHHYEQHVLRKPAMEWPPAVNAAFDRINKDLYVSMQGPSEFGISGALENWDRSGDLARIAVPTLVIGAQYDTMDPAHMRWMAEQLPHGEYLHCPDGSHMAMWDDPEVYHQGIERFIRSAKS
ncbi:MAG: alpha/beta fold hydrolase [Spirochaetaceae bacterium]|nr:MAG: alpha/beta fold hydrolase [Spirochaetaceae bacterium]